MLRALIIFTALTAAAPAAAQAVVDVSRDDYAALAPAGAEGSALVDLTFTRTGVVQSCTVRKSSDNAVLDDASCSLLRERGWPGSSEAKLKKGAEPVRMNWRKPVDPPTPGYGWGGASPIDPQTWMRNGDYPADALRKGEQGQVGFEFDISEAGLVTACRVTQSSNSKALDAISCAIIRQRGRFVPAGDGKGGHRATTGATKMNWANWASSER